VELLLIQFKDHVLHVVVKVATLVKLILVAAVAVAAAEVVMVAVAVAVVSVTVDMVATII
jgi:hypothetical protein